MTKARTIPAVLILLILIITSLVAGHRVISGSSDFDTYYYAGKAILNNLALYTISEHSVNLSKSPFIYPPFFAFFITPLSMIPIYQAAVMWNAISLLSFLGTIFLIIRIMGIRQDLKSRVYEKNLPWLILLAALATAALMDNLVMAQVNCLVFLMVALGIYFLNQSRDFLSGFWIGMAACVKLFPAIFFPYFLIKWKWKSLLGGFLALVLCAGIVPGLASGLAKNIELHRQWFQETIRPHMMPQTLAFYSNQLNPSHQDLKAVVFRWVIDWEHRENTGGPHGREFFFRPPIRLSEKQAGLTGNLAVGFVFLTFIFLAVKTSRTPDKTGFLNLISFMVTTMVLISPKARSHFFIFLIFPWSVLANQITASAKGKLREKQTLLISAFFYFAQGIKYFKFLGFGAFSALALWIYFALKLNKPARENK